MSKYKVTKSNHPRIDSEGSLLPFDDGQGYTLPTASKTEKGGIKVGENLSLSIDGETLNAKDTLYDDSELRDEIGSIDRDVVALEETLGTKQEKLISGVNIKTINNEPVLGDGNITVESGEQGFSPIIDVNPTAEGYEITITDLNGAETVTLKNGIDGSDGPKGEKGEMGLTGARGQQGLPGASTTFLINEIPTGYNITMTDETHTETIAVKHGLDGEKGEKGDQGEQGIQGIQGEKGEKGDKGDQGIQGIQGEKGEKGDKGDEGLSTTFDVVEVENGIELTFEDSTHSVTIPIYSCSCGGEGGGGVVEVSNYGIGFYPENDELNYWIWSPLGVDGALKSINMYHYRDGSLLYTSSGYYTNAESIDIFFQNDSEVEDGDLVLVIANEGLTNVNSQVYRVREQDLGGLLELDVLPRSYTPQIHEGPPERQDLSVTVQNPFQIDIEYYEYSQVSVSVSRPGEVNPEFPDDPVSTVEISKCAIGRKERCPVIFAHNPLQEGDVVSVTHYYEFEEEGEIGFTEPVEISFTVGEFGYED